jgi:hypothetical protein
MTDTSRNDEKFVVRLKPGQREQVKARAKAENRAMNDVVIVALERYIEQGNRFDVLLGVLEKQAVPKGKRVTVNRADLLALIGESGLSSLDTF